MWNLNHTDLKRCTVGKHVQKKVTKPAFRNRTLTKEQRDAKNKQAAEYRKLQSTKDRIKKWNEENKEHLTKYFIERHAKKMQDPEYIEMVRLRSVEKEPSNLRPLLIV